MPDRHRRLAVPMHHICFLIVRMQYFRISPQEVLKLVVLIYNCPPPLVFSRWVQLAAIMFVPTTFITLLFDPAVT